MKEIGKEMQILGDLHKKIIFQVLCKKRRSDHLQKDDYPFQNKKKKLFTLQKPINNIINNLNIEETNENNINENIKSIKEKNTKIVNNFRAVTTPVTIDTNNPIKNDEVKNSEICKTNNNYNYNNNIKNEINNNNSNYLPSHDEKLKQFGNYLCFNEEKIGSGSFGEVLYGIHKSNCREVAVKVLNSDTSQDNIRKEINFTRQLQGVHGFPYIYFTGLCDKKNIIVESLLGPSLDKLFKFCGRIFPLKSVCLIGIEMTKRLESMHEKGILHRDLKPNNLAWGNFNNSYNNINSNNINITIKNDYDRSEILDLNTIYLIDFGLSCSFWENNSLQKHYKKTTGHNFVGTLRYASLNSHKGIRQSRRDDLESMIYILIYFLKGKLPWQDVKAKSKDERYKLIEQIKTRVSIEDLCKDIPNEFAELLKYVKELQFEEKPIYTKFYYIFQKLINQLNSQQIQEKYYNYIWEKMLVEYIIKAEEQNNKKIIEEIKELIFKGYPINLKNFANYIIHKNKQVNENFMKKKENCYLGDSTESIESNNNLNNK